MSNAAITQTTVILQYDAIGNILQDGYWQYTWQSGRQLKAMQHGEAEDADYERLDFAYNADGLRVRKSYTRNNGEGMSDTTVTDYILHGKNIMHMRVTENGALTDEMHFFYDAQGRPALTEHTSYAAGIVATNSYAYIHNLQGDTVGLVDASGTECVRYTYDAWGRMLSITGTKATTLGLLQPFRYRGYVYDEEIRSSANDVDYYVNEFCNKLSTAKRLKEQYSKYNYYAVHKDAIMSTPVYIR